MLKPFHYQLMHTMLKNTENVLVTLCFLTLCASVGSEKVSTSMPRVGFEPTISAGERPKTYALDRAATGTGTFHVSC